MAHDSPTRTYGPDPGPQGELFQRPTPSFSLPRPGELRIGVVDVGSNSVRLVVYDGGARCPAVVFNEKVACGLGRNLAETGVLDPEGRVRALAALTRFAALADLHGVGALVGVATAAVREAEDGGAFRDEVEKRTNIRLRIATGEDEARIAGQGVLFGNPRAEGVVADLGGASMELCELAGGRTGRGISTLLGPLSLPGAEDNLKPARRQIRATLAPLAPQWGLAGGRLYLVGGAWRALAKVRMERVSYPMRLVHEYAMSAAEAMETAHWVQVAEPEMLAAIPDLSSQRLGNIARTGALLEGVIEHLDPGEVVVSAFGLREGLCYEYLPAHLRRLDPLIATCARQERNRARAPGFGADLFRWLSPVVETDETLDRRLLEAACLLSDVCWRAHPDYRDLSCIEAVTRPNLSGAGHRGRAFLGACLMARYRRGGPDAPILSLLGEGEVARAAQIGALLRLGCTVAGAAPGVLNLTPLKIDDGALVLTITPASLALAGEEVDKRLSQAARALGLKPVLKMPSP